MARNLWTDICPFEIPVSLTMCICWKHHYDRRVIHSLSTVFLAHFVGSILSLFLGRDGGPREGSIRLPLEKTSGRQPAIPDEDVDVAEHLESDAPLGFAASLKKRLSNVFSTKSTGHSAVRPSTTSVPMLSTPHQDQHVPVSQTSQPSGSAYGYNGNYRTRLTGSMSRGDMECRLRRRRTNYEGQQSVEYSGLNFTQKLLLANENAVTNIADLWVAAAMNVDNEELYSDGDSRYVDDEIARGASVEEDSSMSLSLTPTTRDSLEPLSLTTGASNNQRSAALPHGTLQHPLTRISQQHMSTHRPSSGIRGIFSHPGVRTPSAVLDALSRAEMAGDSLIPIPERSQSPGAGVVDDGIIEKPPPLTSQLPIPIIIQYGLLALHSTTYDQVFLSYLVT